VTRDLASGGGGAIGTGGVVSGTGGVISGTGGVSGTGGATSGTGGVTVIPSGGTTSSGGVSGVGGNGGSGGGGVVGSGGTTTSGSGGSTATDASPSDADAEAQGDAGTDAGDASAPVLDLAPETGDASDAVSDAADALAEDTADAAPDVADVQPDAGPDAGPDAEPDAGPDVGPDTGPDTGPDAEPDAADPLAANRVLLLHMDESAWNGTTGEVADSSGSNNNGTATNASTVAGGKFSRGGSFDGTGYVTIADATSLNPTSALTMAAWINISELVYGAIICKRTDSTTDLQYDMFIDSSGKLNVDIDGFGNRFTSNATLATGQWYHVVVVYDGTLTAAERVKLYIDGSLDKTATEDSATIPTSTAALAIGLLSGGTDAFKGTMDEVAI